MYYFLAESFLKHYLEILLPQELFWYKGCIYYENVGESILWNCLKEKGI